MIKRTMLLLIAAMIFPLYSAGAAGFQGPGAKPPVTRASEVGSAPDEMPCILEGRIIEKIPRRNNHYLFEDKTGKVIVEIRHRVFRDLTVTPQDILRIIGEVDFDGKYPNQVDVESLSIIGKMDTTTATDAKPAAEPAK